MRGPASLRFISGGAAPRPHPEGLRPRTPLLWVRWHRPVASCGCVGIVGSALVGALASFGRLLWGIVASVVASCGRLASFALMVALGSSVHFCGASHASDRRSLCAGSGPQAVAWALSRDGLVLCGRAPRSGTAASATTSLGSSASSATWPLEGPGWTGGSTRVARPVGICVRPGPGTARQAGLSRSNRHHVSAAPDADSWRRRDHAPKRVPRNATQPVNDGSRS